MRHTNKKNFTRKKEKWVGREHITEAKGHYPMDWKDGKLLGSLEWRRLTMEEYS